MSTSKRRRAQRRPVDKWASKQLYNIAAPEHLGGSSKIIGETIADDPSKLIGRVIETPLSDINDDYSKMHILLRFQITDVAGDTAKTVIVGHNYTRDYLRFLVRRRRTRIDAISRVTTKDDVPIRLTVTGFTTHRAKTSQKDGLRVAFLRILAERTKELDFIDLMNEITDGRLGSEIYRGSKNIFPLKRVEVQKSLVLKKSRGPETN